MNLATTSKAELIPAVTFNLIEEWVLREYTEFAIGSRAEFNVGISLNVPLAQVLLEFLFS